MFNEKSEKWIGIYKGWVIFIFIMMCLFTFIVAGVDSADMWGFSDIDIGNGGFGDFILWFLTGAFASFSYLVVNMLIIQLLNNVQIIRKKAEEAPAKPVSDELPNL